MIKISWLEMANPYFEQAVNAIWDCPMLDGQTSYTAHRIKSGIEKANKDIRALRIEICGKYGKRGEDGKLLNDAQGNIIFEDPERDGPKLEAEFIQAFETHFMELKVSKLDFQKLTVVRGITPRMWAHLSQICENMPDEQAEEKEPEAVAPAPSMIEIPKTLRKKKSKN